MAQGLALRGRCVIQQRTGSGQCGRQRFRAKGDEARHAELFAQAAGAGFHVEVPIRQARAGNIHLEGVERRIVGQHFGGADAFEFAVELVGAAFHHAQFAADEVEPRQAHQRRRAAFARHLRDGQQMVVDLVGKQRGVRQGAGRDDAHDLAFDRPLGRRRVPDLLADGNGFAQLDQLGKVLLGSVERDTRHADRMPVGTAACGERDIEQPRGFFGVFKEELVKVAHAVEDKRVRMPSLQAKVLLHHRRVLVERAVFRVDLQNRSGVFSHECSKRSAPPDVIRSGRARKVSNRAIVAHPRCGFTAQRLRAGLQESRESRQSAKPTGCCGSTPRESVAAPPPWRPAGPAQGRLSAGLPRS